MIKMPRSKMLVKLRNLLEPKLRPRQKMLLLPKRKRNLKHNCWHKNLRQRPIGKQLLQLKRRQRLNSKETLPKRENLELKCKLKLLKLSKTSKLPDWPKRKPPMPPLKRLDSQWNN